MKAGLKMIDFQKAQEEIQKALKQVHGDSYVVVGIHEGADRPEGAPDMTMAKLGAIQHFGADIDHPGGTSYVIGSDGMAKFVPNSFMGPVHGVTGPHKINIPARPWLDVGVASGSKEYIETIAEGIANQVPQEKIMNQVGVLAVGYTQKYITDLQDPPNAASTIRKKGSSNPLVDSGAMRQSVKHALVGTKPEEGL